jgi:translation initiation factor IF-3
VQIRRALELAQEHELDLVEIAPTANPPVCRIMDFSKYKYDQEKKERKARRSQKVVHLKQIRMKPHIDSHDYEIKLNQIRGFLEKKDKVKVNMFFRGREMSHKELGREILDRVVVDTAGLAQPEKSPALEGRIMSIVLTPASGEQRGKVSEE